MKALITGATRGVGKAVAMAFAREGFDLALGARNLDQLRQLKGDLKKNGAGDVLTISADFSSKFETNNFAQSVIHAWKEVDVIVNNVGAYSTGVIDTEGEKALDEMLRINLFSAYHTTLPFLQKMRDKKSGHIFNVCSVLSKQVRTSAPSYTIAKHALKGFNDVLREEMLPYEVKVTAIYPGSINTSSWDGMDVPHERLIQPEDIANAVVAATKMEYGSFLKELSFLPIDKNY